MTDIVRWTVPVDHPAFPGHFPGTPILPGVALLDMALHAITIAAGIRPETCEISAVKFLSPANPGDELEIRHSASSGGNLHFEIVAGTRKIASGTVISRSPS